MVFVNLGKAFNGIPREIVIQALRRQRGPERLTEHTTSRMKTVVGTSDEFKIRVVVHQQGSVLGSALFMTVMEEVTKEARGEAP